jgi:DNA-binding NtrC family response regulator
MPHPSNYSVLLVDDYEQLRTSVTRILRRSCSLYVVEASSGQAALDLLESRPFDVIVSDLRLHSVPNGQALLLICQKLWPGMRRVLLTAHTSADLIVSGVADEVLDKVLDQQTIADTVCRLAKTPREAHD